MPTPDRARRAPYAARLARRAGEAPLALCAGIDPSPAALELLAGRPLPGAGESRRTTAAAAMERFAGLVVESVRDHAVAVKPQVAWFEAAGAPGLRALERTVAFARTAGLLVVLDAKRGDVPHTAAAYAEAWLGDLAGSGMGADALTVNGWIGRDALDSMARVAADRRCGLYALLHTSNPAAAELQAAPLEDGRPWWHLVAGQLRAADEAVGGGVVGAVVPGTRPQVVAGARRLLPGSALLVPGIGAQGGDLEALQAEDGPGSAPTTLVAAARSLLPQEAADTAGFRFHVDAAAARLAGRLRPAVTRTGDGGSGRASASIDA